MGFPFSLRAGSYLFMFGIMLFFEWLAPYARSRQRKSFRVVFHLGISMVNSGLLYLIMTQPLFAALHFVQIFQMNVTHLLGLGGWGELALTLVAFDFWDYWMHRAFHRVGFMWRFHKAHHSDMEIDVTTAARFHIGELILSGISKCLMILLWGASLWGLVAFDVLLNIASQFHHGNLGIPVGFQDRIEKVIVTPRMHRCHHAIHANCWNTNFSAVLSLWDRLFGSYHWAQSSSELDRVGLLKPSGPETMEIKPFLMTPLRKGE